MHRSSLPLPRRKKELRGYRMWSGDCESMNRLTGLRMFVRAWTVWQTCLCLWEREQVDRLAYDPNYTALLNVKVELLALLLLVLDVFGSKLARGLLPFTHFPFTNHILTLHDMSCRCMALYITRPSLKELFKLQPQWLFIVSSFWNVLSSLSGNWTVSIPLCTSNKFY